MNAAMIVGRVIGNCDALDGPLVTLARKALETGDVAPVLPWVAPEDEDGIRRAFQDALAARLPGGDVAELADHHFFEILVCVHRAAEGLPYTGLRPAGENAASPLPDAEKALETGLTRSLVSLFTDAVRSGLHRHFHAAVSRKSFAADDVAAGRRYVEAYESYIRYVERLWLAAAGDAGGDHATQASRGPAASSSSPDRAG